MDKIPHSQPIEPIPFDRFSGEVLALYQPPHRRASTHIKMRQALAEFAVLPGVGTTADISPALIAAWMAAHADRKAITSQSVLRSFRAACTYAKTMGYLRVSPWDWRRDWIAADDDDEERERTPKHRSLAEVARMLDLLRREAEGGGWEAVRLYALAGVLAYTGMRRNEVLTLRPSDVSLGEGLILLRSRKQARLKTKASAGLIGIPAELAGILGPWLARCGEFWLFPNKTDPRTNWTGGSAANRPLGQVKAAALRAGIPAGITLHGLRHSLATSAGRFGMSPLELKGLLRHTSLGTQAHYVGIDADNARDVARRITYNAPPSPV